ncbi:MAG: hypothetical protein AB1635_17350 [Acidobacteriota bacterium]
MTLKKATGLMAAALTALVLASSQAAAQAPTVSVSVNGTTVNLTWTAVSGATGYEVEVVLNGQTFVVPTTVPFITASPAPNGSYIVRVRATAGSTTGPWSSIITFVVPTAAPTCTPPTLTATVAAARVTFSWTNNSGATSGQIRMGRAPGLVEQVQTVTGSDSSLVATAPAIGTYYATLVLTGPCGSLVSAEITIVVTSIASGPGPRTPDPPAGQILPLPSYGASVVQQAVIDFRGDLLNSCVEHGGNNTFLFRLLQRLRQIDSRWGLNWKRGNRGDMSQDVVTYNFGTGADEDTTNVYIIDVISGHCGSRPDWNWTDVTEATRQGGSIGRWTLQPYLAAGFPADQR